MSKLIKRGVRHFRENGLRSFLLHSAAYIHRKFIRNHLPKRAVDYNGIEIPEARIFDSILPWREIRSRPQYETGIINALENHVTPSDDVTVVGAGRGITTIKAAEKTNEKATLIAYEGSKKKIDEINRNLTYHGLRHRVEINHAIVGPEIKLRGEANGARRIAPEELPECDVLELDCEGAEIDILSNLTIHPRVIIVETHGKYGSPTDEVRQLLESMSYDIKNKTVAEHGYWRENCIKDDVYVLTAVRNSETV